MTITDEAALAAFHAYCKARGMKVPPNALDFKYGDSTCVARYYASYRAMREALAAGIGALNLRARIDALPTHWLLPDVSCLYRADVLRALELDPDPLPYGPAACDVLSAVRLGARFTRREYAAIVARLLPMVDPAE